ncbi:sensor histidine kinase [Sphingomonas sp. PAMC 26605]|uniref:sensor histidine kinase n=1 Tax=Sphingomonas sp. PAMC 26605 TaxID=1112214 RepID=UPI00026CCB07|nr:ATP-binding protein [Sphingomonas sp. PAMC 26605]
MTAPRSLLGQFVALHIAVAVIATLTLLWSATTLLHQTADHFQRTLLQRQAEIVAEARASHRAAAVPLTSGMAVAIFGADRRLASSSGPPRAAILAAATLDGHHHFFRRGAVEGYSLPTRRGWIVVSQDDTDPEVVTDDIVRTFLKRFALLILPIAALVPLIGVLLARRLTLRMRAVSAIAAEIGPRSFDTRLPLGLLPREAEPLAVATNAALDRLVEALHVQSAFAADVAHELRTPLAAIRLRADAIADAGVRADLMAAVDRAARVIGQLLSLAELEQPQMRDAGAIDLAEIAESVVADRAPAILAGGRTIALDTAAPVATIDGQREAIVLALENLVDNAAKYTPRGAAIVVRAGPGARLSVADNGLGVSEADIARLKQRFWRGGAAGVEGSGIGVSLVERIARAHGGTLAISRGVDGDGLLFEIVLCGPAGGALPG